MTERQKEPAMPNQRTEKTLSTADMAAAAQQRELTPGSEIKRMEEDTAELTPESEIKRMEEDAAELTPPQPAEQAAPQPVQLLATDEAQNLRSRWDAIQTGFVDEPRRAVEQADSLVAEVMQRLAQIFADERSKLEGQWSRGDNVSTEDLRVALQRYRSFFDRLLSI
ncbi:MAG TPA: hypothetical protein VF909_03440 [Roseiflexaceae bacterium]